MCSLSQLYEPDLEGEDMPAIRAFLDRREPAGSGSVKREIGKLCDGQNNLGLLSTHVAVGNIFPCHASSPDRAPKFAKELILVELSVWNDAAHGVFKGVSDV